MRKRILLLVAFLPFLFGCGESNSDSETKKNSEAANTSVISSVQEISSAKVRFGESWILEHSKVALLKEENGKGLFVFDFTDKSLKQISEASVRELKAFDKQGIVIYTKKNLTNPPKYELRRYSLETNITTKVLVSDGQIRYLQKVGRNGILFWMHDTAFVYTLNPTRIFPAETAKKKLFYYGINRNKFEIFDFGKKKSFSFNGRIIWADVNSANKIAVVYSAPKGTFLIKNGRKKFLGDFENPKISPLALFVAGVKENYDDQKILASDVYIYDLKNFKLFSLSEFSREIKLSPSWSSQGNFISFSTPKGIIKIIDFNKVNTKLKIK